MTKTHAAKRYQVGYNAPVEGAVGDSPKEFHLVGEFDDPFDAIAEVGILRGKNAFILDTKFNAAVTIWLRCAILKPRV